MDESVVCVCVCVYFVVRRGKRKQRWLDVSWMHGRTSKCVPSVWYSVGTLCLWGEGRKEVWDVCRASPGFILSGFFSSPFRQSQNQIGGSCRLGTVKTLPNNNIQEVGILQCAVQCAVAAYSVHGQVQDSKIRSDENERKGRAERACYTQQLVPA